MNSRINKELKVIVTLWDGDIYILEGYSSPAEADTKLALTPKVEMPNGDVIKTSSISKVQSYDSYNFQSTQKSRHKKGQWISNGEWNSVQGLVGASANLDSITGKAKALPAESTQHSLPSGK